MRDKPEGKSTTRAKGHDASMDSRSSRASRGPSYRKRPMPNILGKLNVLSKNSILSRSQDRSLLGRNDSVNKLSVA